ncbi:hypothetical protein BaRGS_00022986 [Batillaria attramentaria]|uniref:Uncharacterized protein n=1 Tax=Batillaria attramentaria TaxID=370345 RepID=A0ABD0KF99_9CAEN
MSTTTLDHIDHHHRPYRPPPSTMSTTTIDHVDHHPRPYRPPPSTISTTTIDHVDHHPRPCRPPPSIISTTTLDHIDHHLCPVEPSFTFGAMRYVRRQVANYHLQVVRPRTWCPGQGCELTKVSCAATGASCLPHEPRWSDVSCLVDVGTSAISGKL